MKIEREEMYFKIYDDNNYLLAYFQPEYGNIQPKEKELEIIDRMIKEGEKIEEGLLYLPMLKFNLREGELDIYTVRELIEAALNKINTWIECLKSIEEIKNVRVVVSHTDPDMLALLLDLRFREAIRLDTIDMPLSSILCRFIDNNLL
ncbi:MAG: hypothetical protein QW416_01025 [Candidatus Nitrosocaldaceae archaeon]